MEKLEKAFRYLAEVALPNRLPLEYGQTVGGKLTSTFRLKDAHALSANPEHQGWYVMQEKRTGCKEPFNHWGFMVVNPVRPQEDHQRKIERLQDWIRGEGIRTNTCTRDILDGEICSNCRCGAYQGKNG